MAAAFASVLINPLTFDLIGAGAQHFGIRLTDLLAVFRIMSVRYFSTVCSFKLSECSGLAPKICDVLELLFEGLAECIDVGSVFTVSAEHD